jgi:hypothetical protein
LAFLGQSSLASNPPSWRKLDERQALVQVSTTVFLNQIPKIRVCQCLRAGHSLVGVVAQKLPNNINTLTRDMLQVFLNPSPRLHRELEIKLHVGVLLEPLENPLVRRAQNLVDFVDLVYLSFAREKRLECQHFVENAPHAPYVHLG